jgi:hypothetical protein
VKRIMLSVSLAAIASIAIGRLEARAPLQVRDDAPVRITVIGCVERSTPIPEPGATTAVPADETRYVLSKITLVPPDRAEPTGTAGSAIEQSVSKYRLDDASASKVAQHVGDRVQITGTLGKGAKAPAAPVLRVDSVTKISSDAASCSK